MSEEKILTKHPEGKKGVNISKAKYDILRESILEYLQSSELTYTEIATIAEKRLKGKFKGSIRWYVEVVKLDLEARGIIGRIPKTKSEQYRLKED